jgi:hypothetical protein
MATDRLPRFSQRNVLAAINRPVMAPGRMWSIGRFGLMAVVRVSGPASLRLSISLGSGDTTRRSQRRFWARVRRNVGRWHGSCSQRPRPSSGPPSPRGVRNHPHLSDPLVIPGT